jgi:hypothetical protein
MPLAELWLSNVNRNRSPASNGYDSPINFSAWLALAVKITAQVSGAALKKRSTALRARATYSVALDDVGLVEWGLPKSSVRKSA